MLVGEKIPQDAYLVHALAMTKGSHVTLSLVVGVVIVQTSLGKEEPVLDRTQSVAVAKT